MTRRNLGRFRQEFGLTQKQMAEKLGVSTSYYKNLERGIYDPSYGLMVRFEKAAAELVGGKRTLWPTDPWTVFKKDEAGRAILKA